jgi:hypothetical protein
MALSAACWDVAFLITEEYCMPHFSVIVGPSEKRCIAAWPSFPISLSDEPMGRSLSGSVGQSLTLKSSRTNISSFSHVHL